MSNFYFVRSDSDLRKTNAYCVLSKSGSMHSRNSRRCSNFSIVKCEKEDTSTEMAFILKFLFTVAENNVSLYSFLH